ncbi:MAG TPA: endonuclease domain-containing protein [Rhodocyclaceae bacterium]
MRGVVPNDRARNLRKRATDTERKLWHHLRDRQIEGHKFRRQHPIGPYFADFVCIERQLIIEADGGQHAAQADYDERRSAFLQAQGFRVLRFWDNDVLTNMDGVLEVIRLALIENTPSPCPSSASGRGGLLHKLGRNSPSPLRGEGRGEGEPSKQ